MNLEELVDPPEQTEHFLPFLVSQGEAKAGLKRWLGSRGFFRPSDLASGARLENLRPILWVGWVFDADCDVTWTADSNLGSRRSAWAPHSGQVQLEFDNLLVSASRGLSEDEVDALSPSYELAKREDSPYGLPANVVDLDKVRVETFDVQRSAARRRIVRAAEKTAAAVVADRHVPGSRVRKVHASVLLRNLETERVAFPAWVLAYRYKGKLFRAVVSGHDPDVATGEAPLSIARIALVVGLVLLAVFAIVAIVAS